MRIALRTGGGRGVYELAGTQGQYGVSDLFEREFIYEFTPELKISGRARAAVRQGKPRIKLDNTRNTTHFYRILTGLLLLPKAKREFRSTGNEEFLGFENYSVATIKIDIGDISSESVVIRPTDLILSNVGGYRKRLKFVDRLSRIMALWEKADSVDSELSVLLRAHKESVSSEDINHKLIEKSAQAISDYLQVVTDPIERIENLMSVVPLQFLDEEEESVLEELESFGLEDEKNPLAAKVENLRQWRKVAIRGSAALRFRFDVRESYNHTCLFTGQRLPKLESIASPGVDAAHILPWSSHGINTINNGICINKQCHWAFDSGVIRLDYDGSINKYVIDVPDTIKRDAEAAGFTTDDFLRISGPIPRDRLPANVHDWPNPTFLNTYNSILFG